MTGDAWFDHQWGDFISVGAGGWDWFAVNLDDGTDLTVSLVRAADGTYPLVYGTLVDAQGRTRHLGQEDLAVAVTDEWTSPATGATYPAGWTITPAGRGAGDPPLAHGAAAGAGHPRHHRGRVLGGLAARGRDPGRIAAGWPGLRGAHRVRTIASPA